MNNIFSGLIDCVRTLALPELDVIATTALSENQGKQLGLNLATYGQRVKCLNLSKALSCLSLATIIAVLVSTKENCTSLRELHLNDNGFHLPEEIELLEAILEAYGDTLVALSLGGNRFGPEGSKKILQALITSTKDESRLQRLDLSGLANTQDTVKLLRELNINIMGKHLKSLNVSNWLPKRLDMTQGGLHVLKDDNEEVQIDVGEEEFKFDDDDEDDDDDDEEEAFGEVSDLSDKKFASGARMARQNKATTIDSEDDSFVAFAFGGLNVEYSEQQFGLAGRPGYFANAPDSQELYRGRSANNDHTEQDTYDLSDYEIVPG